MTEDGPPFVPLHLRQPIRPGYSVVQIWDTCSPPWEMQTHVVITAAGRIVSFKRLTSQTACEIWNAVYGRPWQS